MPDYSTEIEALRKAVATGAKTVTYENKTVTYVSFEELLRRLKWLENQQAPADVLAAPRAGFATFSRG